MSRLQYQATCLLIDSLALAQQHASSKELKCLIYDLRNSDNPVRRILGERFEQLLANVENLPLGDLDNLATFASLAWQNATEKERGE